MDLAIKAKDLTEDEGRCEALGDVYKYHNDNILWSCPMVRLESLWGVSESLSWTPRPDNLLLIKEVTVLK